MLSRAIYIKTSSAINTYSWLYQSGFRHTLSPLGTKAGAAEFWWEEKEKNSQPARAEGAREAESMGSCLVWGDVGDKIE